MKVKHKARLISDEEAKQILDKPKEIDKELIKVAKLRLRG